MKPGWGGKGFAAAVGPATEGSWALEREAHQLLEPVGELAEATGFARKGEVPVIRPPLAP